MTSKIHYRHARESLAQSLGIGAIRENSLKRDGQEFLTSCNEAGETPKASETIEFAERTARDFSEFSFLLTLLIEAVTKDIVRLDLQKQALLKHSQDPKTPKA